jgi:hypothetical protein
MTVLVHGDDPAQTPCKRRLLSAIEHLITLRSHYHPRNRAQWTWAVLDCANASTLSSGLVWYMWSSAARTDALSRLPTDLQSRKPVTQTRQISVRLTFAFTARYLTRPSWGREREVHPVARWPMAPVRLICYSKAYSCKCALSPTERMTCNA